MRVVVSLVIPPPPVDVRMKNVTAEIQGILRFYGDLSAKRLTEPTRSWQGEKPGFFEITKVIRDRIILEIRMGGPAFGKKKWVWLNFGTRVRYAWMTPDFVAQTKVGSYFSKPGQGGFAFLGPPLPGIEARRWGEMSQKRDKEIYYKELPYAVIRGFQKSNQGHQLGALLGV